MSVPTIPVAALAIAFAPVLIVVLVLFRWSHDSGTVAYATGRMLVQLLLVGYVLKFIFESDRALTVAVVVLFMLGVASWIALRPVADQRGELYWKALIAIGIGGLTTLLLVTQVVLDLEPWYVPRYVIPLAGMIFASVMNSVSLAAERFAAEQNKQSYEDARNVALRAALIPLVNSLLVVGLISIPGMMTGQILSGVDPLIAARYQIMVMCMVFGSSGLSAICYLRLMRPLPA